MTRNHDTQPDAATEKKRSMRSHYSPEHVGQRAATASAVRYWTVRELSGPCNSTLLREILRTTRDHARDLWNGRCDYDDEELAVLGEVLRLPRIAFLDCNAYELGGRISINLFTATAAEMRAAVWMIRMRMSELEEAAA